MMNTALIVNGRSLLSLLLGSSMPYLQVGLAESSFAICFTEILGKYRRFGSGKVHARSLLAFKKQT